MSGELYSQSRAEQMQVRCLGSADTSRLWLINENDDELPISQSAFVTLMSLAEQRGWRATAFTRGDLNVFSAMDASRCVAILRSALEDGIPPFVGIAHPFGTFPVGVERHQVEQFMEFCRQGGFWIREVPA